MPSSGRVDVDGTCRAGVAMTETVPIIIVEIRGFYIFLASFSRA
jgi:hypothetical protein